MRLSRCRCEKWEEVVNKNSIEDNMEVWSVKEAVVGVHLPLIGSYMSFLWW